MFSAGSPETDGVNQSVNSPAMVNLENFRSDFLSFHSEGAEAYSTFWLDEATRPEDMNASEAAYYFLQHTAMLHRIKPDIADFKVIAMTMTVTDRCQLLIDACHYIQGYEWAKQAQQALETVANEEDESYGEDISALEDFIERRDQLFVVLHYGVAFLDIPLKGAVAQAYRSATILEDQLDRVLRQEKYRYYIRVASRAMRKALVPIFGIPPTQEEWWFTETEHWDSEGSKMAQAFADTFNELLGRQ